jgi:hypothetical protein
MTSYLLENKIVLILKKILIVLPFHLTLRNLVFSGLAKQLLKDYDCQIAIASPFNINFYKIADEEIKNYKIPCKKGSGGLYDPTGISFFYYLLVGLRIRIFAIANPNGSFLMKTLSSLKRNLHSSWFSWLLTFLAHILFLIDKNILPLKFLINKLIRNLKGNNKFIENVFNDYKPDLVIIGSNSVYNFDILFQLFAIRRKIPVVAFVQSWDNLYSRGPIIIEPDLLLVWSTLMKNQAIKLHDFPPNKISICGPLQFVHYNKKNLENIKNLNSKFNYLLYVTGGSTPEYDIEDFLEFYKIIKSSKYHSLKIIFRPHPQVDRNQYVSLKSLQGVEFDESPDITRSDENVKLFDENEMIRTANLILNAKVIFSSWATTMLLEACIFDKPVVQLRWMNSVKHNQSLEFKKVVFFQNYTHLKDFDKHNPRLFSDTPLDLIQKIDQILINSNEYKINRHNAVSDLIHMPLENIINNCANSLKYILLKNKS